MYKKLISVSLIITLVTTVFTLQAMAATPQSALRDAQTHYWTSVSANTLQPINDDNSLLWVEYGDSYQRTYDGQNYNLSQLTSQITASFLLYDNGDLYLSTDKNPSEGSYSKIMSNVKEIGEVEVPFFKSRYVLEKKLSNNMYSEYKEILVSEEVTRVRVTTILDTNGDLYVLGSPNDIPDSNKHLTNEEYGVVPTVTGIPYKEAQDFRTTVSIDMLYPFAYQSQPKTAERIASGIEHIVPGYDYQVETVYKSLETPIKEKNETSTVKGYKGFYIDKLGNSYFGFPTQTDSNRLANENVINYVPVIGTVMLEDGAIYRDNRKIDQDIKDFGQFTYLKNDGTLYDYENKLISDQVKAISTHGQYYIKYDDSLWSIFTGQKIMEDVAFVFDDHPVRKNGDVYNLVNGENNTILPKKVVAGNGLVPIPSPDLHEGKIFKNASDWALVDLRSARKSGLTFPVKDLSYNEPITREKFSEIAVKLYEKLSGKSAPSVSNNVFEDTTNPEILKAYALGIVKGTSSTTFSPQARITREEIATMLKRTVDIAGFSLPAGTAKTFTDADQIATWAKEAVDIMSSANIVKGITAETFGPKQNATIEQAVIMANRIAQ